MKSDLQVFFSSKFLRHLLLISFFARLFFQFVFLPKTPSAYGPDEATYAYLAKYVAEGFPVQEFPAYGPYLYSSIKTLILPSSALIKLGINEILAVRLVSTFAGLLSLIMLPLCLIAFNSLLKYKHDFTQTNINVPQKIILVIFAFLPSNFLWSNLGLRESSSQLYLIAFTYFSLKLLSPQVHRRWFYAIISCTLLMLAFGSRPQTALIFSLLTFIFGLLLVWKLRNFSIVSVVLLGFIFGMVFTSTSTSNTNTSNTNTSNTNTSNTTTSFPIGKLISSPSPVDLAKSLEVKRNINRIDANSPLPESTCFFSFTGAVQTALCNLRELTYRLPAVLFRPFPIIDSGSPFSNFAGVENLLWLGLFSYAVFVALRRSLTKVAKFQVIWLYLYIITFSTALALYEGNLGTAYRHKSSILWALALGLIISQIDFKLVGKDSNLFEYRHFRKEEQ